MKPTTHRRSHGQRFPSQMNRAKSWAESCGSTQRRIIGYHTIGPGEKLLIAQLGWDDFSLFAAIQFFVHWVSCLLYINLFPIQTLWITRFSPLLKLSTFYIIHLWDGKLDLWAVTLSFFVKPLCHSFPSRGRLHSMAPETVVIHKLKHNLHYIQL